jgi:hypothetical protein
VQCEVDRHTGVVVTGAPRPSGPGPLDPEQKARKRSTRRRQDAPNLPRRPVERRTLGRVYGGKFRPSTFLTLTLDSYGRVDSDGAALDPDRYDYRRAARDAVHFARLVDRFWQNTRRCVGWDVQYFGTVEPQRRGTPHFHAAIRGTIPRAELRAIVAATYHQVWWPAHDVQRYSGHHLPRWCDRAKGFVDPDTRTPLPTWEEATDPANLPVPAHTVRFGAQVHVKGISGGTEEAGRHVGYLTKYLTKSISHAAGLNEDATDRQREHHRRLVAELRATPCSPQCPVWLLYGIQPKVARLSTVPGVCKGKAHRPEHQHRRPPRPRLPQVVQQDARRPPRVRSATPDQRRSPARLCRRRRPLRMGTHAPRRPRRPLPAGAPAARDLRTAAMEGRLPGRAETRRRP